MENNIVLIGMPGSGKSIVGQILARKTGLSFVDLDAFIEEGGWENNSSDFRRRRGSNFSGI